MSLPLPPARPARGTPPLDDDAVFQGKPDVAENTKLAAVIARAKSANMPSDKIKAAVERGSGAGSSGEWMVRLCVAAARGCLWLHASLSRLTARSA